MIASKYTYLLVDLGCVLVPLIASFHPRIAFYRHWRISLPVLLAVATLFISWDVCYTHIGIWNFNPRYVLGYYFFNLPVEEVAFFLCIPYACMFTFYCCGIFFSKAPNPRVVRNFTITLAALLAAIGIAYITHLYTSVTFLLLAAVLLSLVGTRASYLHTFFISFLLVLLPFFISNGILTGTGPDEAVVRYNDAHNVGIRILTIPVEDIFYGMLLQLLNAAGFMILYRRGYGHSRLTAAPRPA